MFSGYEYFKTVSMRSLLSPNENPPCSYIIPSESIYSSIANCGKSKPTHNSVSIPSDPICVAGYPARKL